MAKILLVEDDNNLREIYQARLVAEGYDIVAAQNGEEALVVAKQNKPDLIISDVMMPRISGFEMLDILRNTDELKHTKVIMLTALGQAEDQQRAGNLGADKYLVKSQVTLEDIVNAAKELLDEDGVAPAAPAAEQPAAAAPVAAAEPTPSAPEATAAAPSEPAATTSPEPSAPAATASTPPAPAPSDAVVPASAVPQPDTTVVVPPAPADLTPPAVVTAVPEPPADPQLPPAAPEPPETPTASAADEPAPAPEPAESAAAEAAVTDAATQTLEAEEAALQAQIANYAKQPAETPVAVEPTPEEASNDEALADAVKELNKPAEEEPLQPPSVTNAPEPAAETPAEQPAAAPAMTPAAPPAATPDAPADETGDNKVTVAGKKVIQPLNPIDKPDLGELLAKEEAKAPPAAGIPVVGGSAPQTPQPGTSPQEPPAAAPGQSFDPNSVAL